MPVPASWVEQVYSREVYLSLQQYVTFFTNHVPVALLDIAVGCLLVWLFVRLIADWRGGSVGRAFARALGRLLTAGAAIYLLFLASWGLNYRRVPLEAKLEFDAGRVSVEGVRRLAAHAVAEINAGHGAAHDGRFRQDMLEHSFAEAQMTLGATRIATIGRPKRSLAGFYFRYAAIDGMTVPVFLEIILNPDILPVEAPSVLAHEWAHLAGYADESEASFVGWLAGIRSADPAARYSAWLHAYALAFNALPRHARAGLPPLAEGPRQDLRDIADRYARSSPRVRTAARGIYDSYLKANRIEEGIASYSTALQLMLGTKLYEIH